MPKHWIRYFFAVACIVSLKTHADPASSALERRYYGAWEKDIGYVQAMRVDNLLYVSGITSDKGTMEEQINAVYQELGKILKDYNADFSDIIKENIYTTDIEALKNNIPLRKLFFPKDQYPVASWVQVERLYLPDQKIEVEVMVHLK